MAKKTKKVLPSQRNDSLADGWSLVHFATGVGMGWVMAPAMALGLMILWEPVEIFLLSPVLARFGIVFGFETWRNSLSDIAFDAAGVAFGALVLTNLSLPPFHLF